jgi:Uma2 family endonuclease
MTTTKERIEASPFLGRAMTEDELLALPKDGYRYELVDGRIEGAPTKWVHEDVGANLMALLLAAGVRDYGRIIGSGLGCRMRNGNIRPPDLGFVTRARVPQGAEREEFFDGAPDLAVEILSPSERPGTVHRKLGEYFDAGAQQVWLIRPEERTVAVYGVSPDPLVLGVTDLLTGGELLPGFACRVAELFETE